MKTGNWIVIIFGFALLAGCATTPSLPSLPSADGSASSSTLGGLSTAGSDADQDSIGDSQDACADTAPNVMVDLRGCELATGAIPGIRFKPAVSDLDAGGQQALDAYVEAMLRYPEVVLNVEAHTDNRGTAAANLELSKERVLSVVRYMLSGGVSPDRIKPFGYGESRPRAANATSEGREENRRIEIKVLEGLT